MAGRRTNLALFALLLAAFVTGALAYSAGTGWGTAVIVAHGVAGLGLLLLSPWKSVIARRGLRRIRPGRVASVALSLLVVVAVAFGVAHATGLLRRIGALTAMQIHVGAALIALPLAAWHVFARRVRVRRYDLSRRNLLRSAGLVAGAGAAYVAVQGTTRLAGLPGAARRFTGSYEISSFDPAGIPVTQWLNDSVPSIDVDAWRLTVALPGRTREFAYGEIEEFTDRVTATIDCTGGWFSTQSWHGVLVPRLIGGAAGRSISVSSATGYGRRFPLSDAGNLLLATRVGGSPLSAGHGGPARIVAPGRRGFWWVKWVTRVEVSDVPWWAQSPFPLT